MPSASENRPAAAGAPPAQPRRETEAGMLFMAGAMLLVPGIDALAKLLSAQLSPFQITFIRFGLQAAFLGGLLAWSRALAVPLKVVPRLALGGTFVAAAIGFLVWSLSILPLANAIAIFFVEPLILSLLSALFLGERVGWQRLGAVAVGLLGALVVIRPNWAQFGAAALLPLFAAVFYAAQLTVFRSLSGDLSGPRVQAYSAVFATLVLGIALLLGGAAGVDQFAWHPPRGVAWAYLAGIGVLSTISYLLISSALKRTEAGILAPFQYLEIISATLLGYVVFGDFPDLLTWLGTGIILASGLYVFHRERKVARQT